MSAYENVGENFVMSDEIRGIWGMGHEDVEEISSCISMHQGDVSVHNRFALF